MRLDLGSRFGKLDPNQLRNVPNRVLDDAQKRAQAVRHDLYTRRETGRVRLWSLGTDALERAHDALENAPEALAPVTGRLNKAVEDGLDLVTRPPIADYDELNVKQVSAALEGLALVSLERVVRYERAHKDRVTVYRAVDRAKERLLADPAAA